MNAKLLRWECLSTAETIARLRRVPLKGFGAPLVYASAILSLERAVSTDFLMPAQRYVLKNGLDNVSTLAVLLARNGVDLFALEGVLRFWLEWNGKEEGPISLTPPVVEESRESDGRMVWLINDGMHRATVARRLGRSANILLARCIPCQWPYYALPLPGGWAAVEELHSIPDNYSKRIYRQMAGDKTLFRDFNAVFPGIQKQRNGDQLPELRKLVKSAFKRQA